MAAASNVFRRIMVAAVMFAVSFAIMSAADEPTTQDTTDALLELLEDDPGNVGAMSQLYAIYMRQGDYREAQRYALKIYAIAEENGNTHTKMLADSYLGQSYLAMDGYDSAYVYLNSAVSMWNMLDSTQRNDEAYSAIYTAYNSLGIYSVTIDMDFGKAIDYFLKGLKLAEARHDYFDYAILGSNLVVVYNLREDSDGLKYALEVYRYGKEMDNPYIVYCGAHVSALMYFLKGDLANTEKYLDEAMLLVEKYFDRMGVYCLYAQLQDAKGNKAEAEKYYRLAVEFIDEESVPTAISIYLSYGEYLYREGRYDESLEMLGRGIELALSRGNRIYTYRLYELESLVYEALGEPANALSAYKSFHNESVGVFNIERERSVNELTRKYENERHERELQQHNVLIMKKNQELLIASFVIVAIVAVLVAAWVMYKRKNRMYMQIALRYKASVDREKQLQQRIDELSSSSQPSLAPSGKYSNSSLTEDSGSELFGRLESLMRDGRLYCEKNLTRERVAEALGSNRTYLSQVINDKAGCSFFQYINSFRTEEAIRQLSDPSSTIPLKALADELGFSSVSAFYKSFQEKVGMPPAKYREKIVSYFHGN